MGMDYFIIEQYFSKLGSSIYENIEKNAKLDVTAQFGIGVFSYFMICDQFTVISKKDDCELIKFHVQKDVDSYFHFKNSDHDYSLSCGSKIIFKIKKSIRSKINPDSLIKLIRKFMWFNEIPVHIEIKNNKQKCILNQLDYSINLNRLCEIANINTKRKSNLEIGINNLVINQPTYTLSLCVYYSDIDKERRNIITYLDNHKKLRLLRRRSKTKVFFCYKGIIVEEVSNIDSQSRLFNFIAIVNVLEKKSLDLSRNSFLDRTFIGELTNYVSDLALLHFFNNIPKNIDSKQMLLNHYSSSYDFNKFDFQNQEIILNYAIPCPIFRVLKSNLKYEYMDIRSLKEKKITKYLYGIDGDVKLGKIIVKKYNCPILIPFNRASMKNLVGEIIFKTYYTQLVIEDSVHYFEIDYNSSKPKFEVISSESIEHSRHRLIFIPFNNKNYVFYNINASLFDYRVDIFNLNCPIISFLYEKSTKDMNAKKLLIEKCAILLDSSENKKKELLLLKEKIFDLWNHEILIDELILN